MARSNSLPFSITASPPLEGVGWEVRVLSEESFTARRSTGGDGVPLIIISKYIDASIGYTISELGVGAVTLDLDDPMWATTLTDGSPAPTLLEREHLWQVWENGALRAEFLAQTRTETWLADSETRTVVVSGPLGGAALRRALVLTPTYPGPPPPAESGIPGTYQFVNLPVMACWLQLLGFAQARGTGTFLDPTFTRALDSAGQAWEDTPEPPPDPTIGTTILAGDVNFASNSSTLTGAATANIEAMVAAFRGTNPQVTCIGHADSTNTHAYNQTLSVNRANAVRTRILSIDPTAVVRASGRGETQPVASNATAAGRARNRRVTVTYPTGPEPDPPPTYSPPLGISLYDLLVELSGADLDQPAPIRVEWVCWPAFKLDVRRTFGTRREHEVVFYEGSTHTVSKARERMSNEVGNLVALQNEFGEYSVASSATSITRWGQREVFRRQPGEYDPLARGAIADATLRQTQDERATWTLKVAPYAAGRTVFTDYGLGDWIGVVRFLGGQPGAVEAFRVMAITLRVDSDGVVDVELLLQSTADAYQRRLQQRITSLINHRKEIKVIVQDAEPVGGNLGDLWTPATSGL